MSLLKMNGITKSFNGVTVLHEVNLTVGKGEVHALLGENGAGKSTLMNVLTGVFPRDAGTIVFDGQDVGAVTIRQSEEMGIAFVHQELNLFNDLRVFENIFLGREYCNRAGKLDKKRMIAETRKLFEELGVEMDPTEVVANLKTSQKQLLEISKALFFKAKLLILDEPTNVLDPAGIQEMRELICTLPSEYGITVIVSSHLLSEIDQMADHVGIIRKGELVYQDTLESLHSHSKEQIAIRVSHTAIALDLLRQDGVEATEEDDYLLLPMADDAYVANLCRLLVAQNISLYRIEKREKSLEDIFLSLTGKESSL